MYATTAAPPTIDETLDFAREKLDIIAPAAELLYKNAAEKMLKESSSGFVVGPSVVGGVKCTHLAFRGAEVDWQIWIEDGDKPLPRKFILTSKKVTGEPQFTVLIRSWDVAPKLTNKEFTFRATQRRQEDRVSPADCRSRQAATKIRSMRLRIEPRRGRYQPQMTTRFDLTRCRAKPREHEVYKNIRTFVISVVRISFPMFMTLTQKD